MKQLNKDLYQKAIFDWRSNTFKKKSITHTEPIQQEGFELDRIENC